MEIYVRISHFNLVNCLAWKKLFILYKLCRLHYNIEIKTYKSSKHAMLLNNLSPKKSIQDLRLWHPGVSQRPLSAHISSGTSSVQKKEIKGKSSTGHI